MPKKANTKTSSKQRQKRDPLAGLSVENLLERAGQLVAGLEFDAAREYFEAALRAAPNDVKVLDEYASFLLEIDEWEKGLLLTRKSIEIAPDDHHAKWMNLGQLSHGEEAAQYFLRGAQILEHALTNNPATATPALRRELSDIYCSMAEIYLTDECFHEEAEQRCETYLTKALQIDPQNAAAYQTLASVRLSQQRAPEALTLLETGYALWKPKDDEENGHEMEVAGAKGAKEETDKDGEDDNDNEEEEEEEDDEDDDDGDDDRGEDNGLDEQDDDNDANNDDDAEDELKVPNFEVRFQCGKMFMECGRLEMAVEIWERLLDEDDTVAEMYYCLGKALVQLGELEDAREHLQRGVALLQKFFAEQGRIKKKRELAGAEEVAAAQQLLQQLQEELRKCG